jgi:4-aminobutyrate aminotransferase-like enzyme
LACAVAERILDVIEREDLMANARRIGDFLVDRLRRIQGKYPHIISDVRGLGLMIGIEFEAKLPIFTNEEKSPAIQVVNRLHEKGVLTVPAATSVIRLLPPLNLSESEADEGLHAIKNVVEELNG